MPTPYLAKAYWVTLERWDALRPRQIEDELRRAHALIFEKLPKRTRTLLAMPEADRKKLIRERKAVLAARASNPKTSSRTDPKAKSARSTASKRPVKKR